MIQSSDNISEYLFGRYTYMFKKIMKVLLGVTILAGAAAGAYYFLTRNDDTDFDDFDEESNDDLQDFLDKETKASEDHYVSLDLTKDKVSEDDKIIGDVKKEEESKIVKADEEANDAVEGFSFTDLT